jgi:hypothetical protein
MTDKLYWDYECKMEVGEYDIPFFASLLKKPLIKISKESTTLYNKNKRRVHVKDLLSPIAFMLRHRIVLPEGARSLPDQCDKMIEAYLQRSLSRRFTGAAFLSGEQIFREHYVIPTLKAIARKPLSLVGDKGLIATCVTTAECNLPVRNYKEAAWVLLAIVGEVRGLDVWGGGKTTTYLLLDTPTNTKEPPETNLRKKIKDLVTGWVAALLDQNTLYTEYWRAVLKEPRGYPDLSEVLCGLHRSIEKGVEENSLRYLLKGVYGKPENLRHQNIQRDLDTAVTTLRHNAEVLNTYQRVIRELFPEDKKQMILEILEAFLHDAMIHINGPVFFAVDGYRREIVTLLLEGHYPEVKEALIAKLATL